MGAAERTRFTTDLRDPDSRDPSRTGGKGANLACLCTAEFRVPPGFCVTTDAYRALVDDRELETVIRSLDDLDPTDSGAISKRSADVRSRFRDREFPESVRRSIVEALIGADADAYAVRSSATAEDLPTASFAGQHETFLAVRGQTAVVDRVRDCMASLFTERAVTYRLRNGISQSTVEMAVVVQEMVEPAVAGVLFTADPVSGNRHVTSVDASFGLGEAVVAGIVSPDTARVDRRTGEVIEYEIGEKDLAVRSCADETGGTETVSVSLEERTTRALTDAELWALVDLGGSIEALLGAPQDVEWALVGGEFVVLQSRPITSLYPLPSPLPTDDVLHIYLSFGHQQAMPDALPPLVVDFWQGFLNGAAARFRPERATDPLAVEAGNRVYLDLTPLLRIGPLRRALTRGVAAMSEPASEAIRTLLDRRGSAMPVRGRVEGLLTIARALVRGAPILRRAVPGAVARFVRAFVVGRPSLADDRAWFETLGEGLAASVRRPTSHEERVRVSFERFDLALVLSRMFPRMASFPAAVVAGTTLVRMFPDAVDDVDAIGKGFEAEIVTRMNQRLGDLADVARAHPEIAAALREEATMDALDATSGGQEFVDGFDTFLDEFGHRATGEIDLSRPRWRDDPATLLETVRSNLGRGDPGEHREHLHRLQRDADEAAARLESRAGHGLLGPVRKRLVRRLIETHRGGIQIREYPKQGVAHLFAACHDVVSEAGESLADEGRLDQPRDVWYLREEELLAALATGSPIEVDVAARRRMHERYAAMVAPPLMTSEGELPKPPTDPDLPPGTLTGTPVSAGIVEGTARVIRDPSGSILERGEILVAPATDPGWTPLFLNAAGLVMEVGGRMTHGALVAREYGIPAVASVAGATATIRTGDRVRVDGKRGIVQLLDCAEDR